MAISQELEIVTGNSHRSLANEICKYLDTTLSDCEVFKFSNDNIFVKYNENIREKDVFIIQSISTPVSDHLMELLIMIDAAKRASAGRITAVMPYFAYGRSDKKDQPRVPITARLIANLITVAGADRVLTMDLHAGQIQGFFNIPVDELSAVPILAQDFKENGPTNSVVAATDVGDAKRARNTADILKMPIAIVEKQRLGNEEKIGSGTLIGKVKGLNSIIIDDEIGTGGTVISAANILKENGAKDIYCYVTHPVLSGNAAKLISDSVIKNLVITNTLPITKKQTSDKLRTVSIANLFGEAIFRIHNGLSIGAMFNQKII